MSVDLVPELGFRRPFNREVSQVLRIKNPNSDPVAFKVKTTAPKQYCVRPNSGRIEAGKEVEVQVLLQAMKEDPPPDAKCRDKFLVQSVAITADKEFSNVGQIWAHVEKTSQGSIVDKKIRVTFLPAAESTPPPTNGHVDAPPAYSSPYPQQLHTPQTNPTGKPDSGSDRSKSPGEPDAITSAGNSVISPSNEGSSRSATTSAGLGDTSSLSKEDLEKQLRDALAKISKLQQQLEEQGLRQRKVEAVNQDSRERITTGTTGMGIQSQPPEGIPVQITAALCLLAFLLAYFFF